MRILPAIRRIHKVARATKKKAKKFAATPPKQKYYYEFFCKHFAVDDKKILLDSFNGKGITDSGYAILQELIAEGLDREYEIYFTSKDPETHQAFVDENNLPIKLVDTRSRTYAYMLATVGHLMTNTAFPTYFIRRPGQICVDTWHGTPLKTLGKQMRLGMQSMFFAQHTFMQTNWFVFPNDYTREVMMRDYNMEDLYTGKLAMVGYPRNTVFLQGKDERIRKEYDLDGYTTFAYMPTWRGKSSQEINTTTYVTAAKEILCQLDRVLRDDQKMFVNFHPMVASFITMDEYEHILPFPKSIGTYDFLTQLDVLITDYSSVMFDFALTRKPIVLFTYDEDEYLHDRGFYFPLSDLPFPRFQRTEDLVECLKEGNYFISEDAQKDFNERFLKYDSINNSKYVVSILLGIVPEELVVIDYGKNRAREWNVVNVKRQDTLADINGIFLSSQKDKDVILLKRAGFGGAKSRHLVNHYLDGYNFMFITSATPRTFVEEATKRFWAPTKARLSQRERLRVFGDLPTAEKERRTYLVGVPCTTFSGSLSTTIPASYSVDGTELIVRFETSGYVVKKLMLVTKQKIRWVRDLTQKEASEGHASLDVIRPLCSPLFKAGNNTRAKVCLLVEDTSGNSLVADLQLVTVEGEKIEPVYGEPIGIDRTSIEHLLSYDENGKTRIPFIDKALERELTITPYASVVGRLSLLFTYRKELASGERIVRTYSRAMVTSMTTPRQKTMRLKIIIPSGDYELTSIEIRNRYRGSSTIYELDYSYRKHKDHLSIKARFDPNNRVYDGLFWDIFVIITESDGNTFEVPCYTGDAFRHSLYFRNLQCVLDDGNILFPYATKGTKLAFLHRKLHKSDTLMTRAKEWAAFFSYYLLLPYWHRRRIWLTYEKLCSHAQDNSYAFFKYCMDQIPERASKHVYYIIDKDVPEFKKVQQYGNNIVDFMSYRHMLYALAASIYVSSDSISHMYQWRPKPSVIRRLMDKRKMMFLQHGVTALKRVDHLFGTRGTTPMTYFVTTSSAEQAIVKSFGYSDKRAPILGFTRWDILEDKSNPAHPVVLMMPTWRRWLEDVDDQTFLDSDYFKSYSALINNSALLELLERRGVVLKYFIHPKLHEQLRHFDKTSERIQLIDIDTTPLNELIMECSALVTDYSSVSWDVLYMDKPVVYYQFDQERYLEESGSYVDLNVDLPGPVCMDAESVVNAVADIIDSGFELSSEYKNLAKKWYAFKDRNNCERTYNFLLSRGF